MRCAPRLFARRCHSHVGRSQAYQRALRSLPQRTPRQRLPNHTRWPNMPTPFISKDKIYSTQLHGVYEQHMDFSTSRPIRARRVDQLLVALMRPGPVVSLVLEPSIRLALVALGGFAMADGPSATLLSFGIKSPNSLLSFLVLIFPTFLHIARQASPRASLFSPTLPLSHSFIDLSRCLL